MHQKVKLADIDRDPGNPARIYDREALLNLGNNIKEHGQQIPLIVYQNGQRLMLVDGDRRTQAMLLALITEADAEVLPEKPTPLQVMILRASIDIHRKSYSHMARSDLLAAIIREKKCGVSDLAALVHMDQSMVSKLLTFQKLVPALKVMLAAGTLDIEKAYRIASADPDKQAALFDSIRTMTREQMRSSGKPKADQPKAKRAVFALPNGIAVTIQGIEVTLGDAIERLLEAAKQLRKGLSEGWDITTAQRVMRDRAKVTS